MFLQCIMHNLRECENEGKYSGLLCLQEESNTSALKIQQADRHHPCLECPIVLACFSAQLMCAQRSAALSILITMPRV